MTRSTDVQVSCSVDHSDTASRKESIEAGTQKIGEQSLGIFSGGITVVKSVGYQQEYHPPRCDRLTFISEIIEERDTNDEGRHEQKELSVVVCAN